MDTGRRRLALGLRGLRLRAALTRLTWLAEDSSGVAEGGGGEDGPRGTANAEGGSRGVVPTPELQPGLGEGGMIMVNRTCGFACHVDDLGARP